MAEPLNPQQLPQPTASLFVAYGPEVRVADPQGGDDPITVRAQTYVTYYRGIQIKDITEGGRSGDADVATVEFVPESVNLHESISAKIDPDDPLLAYVRQQHEQGQPVDIAIEIIRKAKNRTTKQPIAILTPIHALRGATDASGTGAQTGPSFDNTRKMLVMANGRAGRALTSNPYEWSSLVTNKAGNLPPEGWRFYAPGDSWDQYGAIVPSTNGTRTPAGVSSAPAAAAPDLGAFLSEIEGMLHKVLDHRDANPNVEVVSGRPIRRRFDEGKQWDVRTNDGRINLGGYGVQSQAWTYRWAYDQLATDDNTPTASEAWTLADTVMSLADRVQSDAYGHGVAPDRTSASHKEAVRWVEWVITHHHPYPGTDDDTDTWTGEVAKAAIEHLVESAKRLGDWVQENKARPQQSQPTPDEPQGPSPAVIKALLGSIERTWTKRDALVNFAQEATERGLADIEVGVSLDEQGTPTLTHPSDPNATGVAPLGQLLSQRIAELQEPSSEDHATERESTDPEQADEAEQPAAPAPAAVAEPQAPSAAQDPNRGYTPQVVEVIRAIHVSTDLGTLRKAYDLAQASTVLQATVSTRLTDNGIEFGYNGQGDGYATKTIAQVIDALRETYSGPPAADHAAAADHENAATPDPQSSTDTVSPEPVASEPVASEPVAPEPVAPEPVAPEPVAPDAGQPATTDDESGPDVGETSKAQQIADSINPQTSTSTEVAAAIERAQQDGVFEDPVTVEGRTGLLRAYLHSVRKRIEKAGR